MGHISSECPQPAAGKKRPRTGDANVVTEFINCEDDEPEGDWYYDEEYEENHIGYLVDEECETALIAVDDTSKYRGCLVVGTGCSSSVSSMHSLDLLCQDRRETENDFYHEVKPSKKRFGFANGHTHQCTLQVSQEIGYGLLAGEVLIMEILDQPGNATAPLLSIADIAEMGGVLDPKRSTISIRDKAPVKVPRTRTGLMVIPVTKPACDYWQKQLEQEEGHGAGRHLRIIGGEVSRPTDGADHSRGLRHGGLHSGEDHSPHQIGGNL